MRNTSPDWPLSMNIDYEKFIDSRFAMNIYKLAAIGSTTEETAAPSVTLPKDSRRPP